MMRRLIESVGPAAAAVTAALLAPALTDASWSTALGAGVAVTLIAAAHALSGTRQGWPVRSLALLTLGLLALGCAVALGPVLGAPVWIAAAPGLRGGAVRAVGAVEQAGARAARSDVRRAGTVCISRWAAGH